MANHGPSFGLSRELERKNQARFSIVEALEVLHWMEQVNGTVYSNPPLAEVTSAEQVTDILKDGVQLCILMNRLMTAPGNSTPITFNKNAKMPFHKMENISKFLEACKMYGVSEISCFQTVDLYENKHAYKVIECLRSLAAVAQSKQRQGICPVDINFPQWVVKIAQNCPRKFSKEVIQQREAVIPLQYGTNKCASQKGMTPYGLARQIKQQPVSHSPNNNTGHEHQLLLPPPATGPPSPGPATAAPATTSSTTTTSARTTTDAAPSGRAVIASPLFQFQPGDNNNNNEDDDDGNNKISLHPQLSEQQLQQQTQLFSEAFKTCGTINAKTSICCTGVADGDAGVVVVGDSGDNDDNSDRTGGLLLVTATTTATGTATPTAGIQVQNQLLLHHHHHQKQKLAGGKQMDYDETSSNNGRGFSGCNTGDRHGGNGNGAATVGVDGGTQQSLMGVAMNTMANNACKNDTKNDESNMDNIVVGTSTGTSNEDENGSYDGDRIYEKHF